jgi:hypothetical protein
MVCTAEGPLLAGFVHTAKHARPRTGRMEMLKLIKMNDIPA